LRYFSEFGKPVLQKTICGGMKFMQETIVFFTACTICRQVHVRYLISWWVSCQSCKCVCDLTLDSFQFFSFHLGLGMYVLASTIASTDEQQIRCFIIISFSIVRVAVLRLASCNNYKMEKFGLGRPFCRSPPIHHISRNGSRVVGLVAITTATLYMGAHVIAPQRWEMYRKREKRRKPDVKPNLKRQRMDL